MNRVTSMQWRLNTFRVEIEFSYLEACTEKPGLSINIWFIKICNKLALFALDIETSCIEDKFPVPIPTWFDFIDLKTALS